MLHTKILHATVNIFFVNGCLCSDLFWQICYMMFNLTITKACTILDPCTAFCLVIQCSVLYTWYMHPESAHYPVVYI